MRKEIICPECRQNLGDSPHNGKNGKNCPLCGQGKSWKSTPRKSAEKHLDGHRRFSNYTGKIGD
jgi:hypothetical protein